MDMLETFGVDEKRVKGGVWHVIEANAHYPVDESEIGDRSAVLIGSTDNPQYRKAIQRMILPYRKRGEVNDEIQESVAARALAEVILLGWRNWQVGGVELPYSKDKAIEILSDVKWVRLKAVLLDIAGEDDVFKIKQEEAITKNS